MVLHQLSGGKSSKFRCASVFLCILPLLQLAQISDWGTQTAQCIYVLDWHMKFLIKLLNWIHFKINVSLSECRVVKSTSYTKLPNIPRRSATKSPGPSRRSKSPASTSSGRCLHISYYSWQFLFIWSPVEMSKLFRSFGSAGSPNFGEKFGSDRISYSNPISPITLTLM